MYTEELQKKWQPVIEHPDLPEIKDAHRRAVVATLLENQEIASRESAAGSGGYQSPQQLLLLDTERQANLQGGVRRLWTLVQWHQRGQALEDDARRRARRLLCLWRHLLGHLHGDGPIGAVPVWDLRQLVSIHREEAQGLRLGSANVHRKPGRRERQGRPRQPANLEGDHAAENKALGAARELEGAAGGAP